VGMDSVRCLDMDGVGRLVLREGFRVFLLRVCPRVVSFMIGRLICGFGVLGIGGLVMIGISFCRCCVIVSRSVCVVQPPSVGSRPLLEGFGAH
jgi:hypothetical protein